MHRSQLTAVRVAGALLAGLAVATAARWVLPWESVLHWVPGSRHVGFFNPLLFGLASLGIFAADAQLSRGAAAGPLWRRLGAIALGGLWMLSALHLFEIVSGIELGIDLPSPGSVVTPQQPHPGRLSPNACVAFIACGVALWLLPRRVESARADIGYRVANGVVALIGLAGLAGHFLGLATLYAFADTNSLRPATAFGFVVAAIALWALRERTLPFDLNDAARRIQRRSLAVVALLALSAGVAGFATLRSTFEETVATSMRQTAVNNATSLAHTLDVALAYPGTLATRPLVRQGLAHLTAEPGDAVAREALQSLSNNLLHSEVSEAEFYNAQGRRMVVVGESIGAQALLRHPLRAGAGREVALVWSQRGYFLMAETPVLDERGRIVGRIHTEQPLPLVDQLLAQMRRADATSDAALCGREGSRARCAATRFRPQHFELPLHDIDGEAGSAIARALDGHTGVLFARDPRGKDVLSAYAPLSDYGLALGYKTDLDTLYAPLRKRIALLLGAMAAIIALAIYALRSTVQPVLMRLVESERKMKAILEDQSEMVSLATPEGRLTYVNPSYARHFGVTPEQLLGANLLDHVYPPDRPAVEAKIAHVVDTGVPYTSENRMLDPEGPERWVSWTNSLQLGPRGEPMLHSVGRDVTERRQLEDALRELTAIFENTSDYVLQTTRRGDVTYLNPAARAVLGLAPDAPLAGLRFSDFNTPETTELLARVAMPEVERRGIWIGETSFIGHDGTRVPVNHMVIGHSDSQGRVTRYSGIMRNIAEELAIKRDQQRQAAVLRAITEAVPGFVAVVDAERRYRYVNSGFERWAGKPRSELVGRLVSEVLEPADLERSLPWMERALAGESVNFERDYPGHAVAQHVSITYIPMFSDGGRVEGFIGIGQDISHHKREEGRLIELSQRDPLTGLLNRAGFERFLQMVADSARGLAGVALLYLDLDHFKPVNDTHGHATGDELLRQFAERLRGAVRPSDAVARLGGDEFGIVLVGIRDRAHAELVAKKVVAVAHRPFQVGPLSLQVGASVGVACSAGADASWSELLERADARLYEAKAGGRGRYAG